MGRSTRSRVAVRFIRVLNSDGTTRKCFELDEKGKHTSSFSQNTTSTNTRRSSSQQQRQAASQSLVPTSPPHITESINTSTNTTPSNNSISINGIMKSNKANITVNTCRAEIVTPSLGVQDISISPSTTTTTTLSPSITTTTTMINPDISEPASPNAQLNGQLVGLQTSSAVGKMALTTTFADELLKIETIAPMQKEETFLGVCEDVMLELRLDLRTEIDFFDFNSSFNQSEEFPDLFSL